MSDSISNRIERIKAGKTTKSQRILLDYISSIDFNKIIYMSITQLAEATGVAEATVLRFCRSLGFNGYQEFKLHLAQETVTGSQETEGIEYASEIVDLYKTALENCRKNLSPQLIDQAISFITSARTVSCCGVGHSYLAALELHNRLLKMGVLTYCEQDMHFQNILISSRKSSDLLIIFSVSGGTKDVIEAAEQARACGMKIIVITSYERSPLSRYADLVLVSGLVESPSNAGAVYSKIMQLFMVDVLCQALHRTDKALYDALIAKGNVATAGKLV